MTRMLAGKDVIAAMVIVCLPVSGHASVVADDGVSALFCIGEGRLEYRAGENGDRIPDFSCCRYGGGGVALPDVTVMVTLDPVKAGDDTARIQAAFPVYKGSKFGDYGLHEIHREGD